MVAQQFKRYDQKKTADLGLVRVESFKERIERIGKEMGKQYVCWVNKYFHAGVDMLICEVNEKGLLEIVGAVESTNYRTKNFYINEKKFQRYVDDLCFFGKYGAKMILLMSYEENLGRSKKLREERLKTLCEKGIYPLWFGGQDVKCYRCGKIIEAREPRTEIGKWKFVCASCLMKEERVKV